MPVLPQQQQRSVSSRRRFSATDLALISSFTALIAVLGVPGTVYLGGSAVPITLQTAGVMLAGAILGWRRGLASVLLLIALVAIGLPLLAGGRGGLGVFAGPTVGYLIGWVPGVAVIGLLVERRTPLLARLGATVRTAIAAVIGGIGVIYLCGITVLAARGLGLSAAMTSALVYLPGDLIKVAVTVVVAGAVHRAFPDLLTRPGR